MNGRALFWIGVGFGVLLVGSYLSWRIGSGRLMMIDVNPDIPPFLPKKGGEKKP